MQNNLVVAISGGAGIIGSAFSQAVVENGGKIIIGDVDEQQGNLLVNELGIIELKKNHRHSIVDEILKEYNNVQGKS